MFFHSSFTGAEKVVDFLQIFSEWVLRLAQRRRKPYLVVRMELLPLLKSGDESAWNQVYPQLWSVAFGVTANMRDILSEEDRKDLAIHAIHELQKRVHKINEDAGLTSFVATIANRLAADEIRRRKALKRGEGKIDSLEEILEQPDFKLILTSPDEAGGSERRDRLQVVAEAFEKVFVKHREVMRDYYFHNLTYAEIVKKRGLPQGTVGVYLTRGREELKDLLLSRLDSTKVIPHET